MFSTQTFVRTGVEFINEDNESVILSNIHSSNNDQNPLYCSQTLHGYLHTINASVKLIIREVNQFIAIALPFSNTTSPTRITSIFTNDSEIKQDEQILSIDEFQQNFDKYTLDLQQNLQKAIELNNKQMKPRNYQQLDQNISNLSYATNISGSLLSPNPYSINTNYNFRSNQFVDVSRPSPSLISHTSNEQNWRELNAELQMKQRRILILENTILMQNRKYSINSEQTLSSDQPLISNHNFQPEEKSNYVMYNDLQNDLLLFNGSRISKVNEMFEKRVFLSSIVSKKWELLTKNITYKQAIMEQKIAVVCEGQPKIKEFVNLLMLKLKQSIFDAKTIESQFRHRYEYRYKQKNVSQMEINPNLNSDVQLYSGGSDIIKFNPLMKFYNILYFGFVSNTDFAKHLKTIEITSWNIIDFCHEMSMVYDTHDFQVLLCLEIASVIDGNVFERESIEDICEKYNYYLFCIISSGYALLLKKMMSAFVPQSLLTLLAHVVVHHPTCNWNQSHMNVRDDVQTSLVTELKIIYGVEYIHDSQYLNGVVEKYEKEVGSWVFLDNLTTFPVVANKYLSLCKVEKMEKIHTKENRSDNGFFSSFIRCLS